MRFCLITAMRDVEAYVAPFRRMVECFTVRPIHVIIGENDSQDKTGAELARWAAARVIAFRTGVPAYPQTATAARSSHLAATRNRLIDEALRLPDWDFALMQDGRKWSPPDLVEHLLAHNADIVAPLILDPRGAFYDTWCFRLTDGRPFRPYDLARLGCSLMEVASVGGVYLVRREVLDAGCRLRGGSAAACDSAGLCCEARRLGFRVFVDHALTAVACPNPVDFHARTDATLSRPPWPQLGHTRCQDHQCSATVTPQ